MNISHAHVKQLAAQGYTKKEVANKLNITMLQLVRDFIVPFREGQHLYCQKQLQEYNKQRYGTQLIL